MNHALEQLWQQSTPGGQAFDDRLTADLPEPARRFLRHAIAPGAPMASAVRLRMHGEIKLSKWAPFVAEQVIAFPAGMVWAAKANMGLPVSGYDRLLGSEGEMNWRLLGFIPVMSGSGPDVSASAAGRLAGELCWLPTALLSGAVQWGQPAGDRQPATVSTPVGDVQLTLDVDGEGRLRSCEILRWGNPGGDAYRHVPFGVVFQSEETFGDFTIGSELRAGWNYPGDPAGEFFRAVIDSATYR